MSKLTLRLNFHPAFTALAIVAFLSAPPLATSAPPPPAILVEATYPGANAAVVEDTVAAPLEQQVNGVEKAVRFWSRCGNDGSYAMEIAFAPGTDLNMAQVLVQNRVALAQPVLPDAVRQGGIAVRKKSPGLLAIVCLFSSDARYDSLYLGNYATIQIRDELVRVAGVADVALLGQRDFGFRISVDPDKLAARGLTAAEVVRALEGQNVRAAAGQIGQPPAPNGQQVQYTVTTLGRLTNAEQFADIVLKADPEGRVVRLRDVARVELGGAGGFATLDGRPVAALAVYPLGDARPQAVSAALRERMAELRKHFPEGLDYEIPFDFAASWAAPERPDAPAYLALDVNLPASASAARTAETLQQADKVLRMLPGVRTTMAFSEQPFDRDRSQPCLLASLDPTAGRQAGPRAREAMARQVPGAAVRLRDLSGPGRFPRGGYDLDLAVCGPERGREQELAERLSRRLSQEPGLTDIWSGPGPVASLTVDIDRATATALGVSTADVVKTLQAVLGTSYVNDVNAFGRTWQVTVRADERGRSDADSIKQLRARNSTGQMVPLGSLVTVRDVSGPAVLNRLDLSPAVEITANAAPGLSLAEARSICERLAGEELPAGYRLTWLREMPAAKAPAGPAPPPAPAAAPPPPVRVAQPVQREVTEYADFTGRLDAVQTVELRARVSGYLTRVLFAPGPVRKGDLLFEIDPRPYQAELARAEAELQLREAHLKLATAEFDRARALAARGGAGREELDRAEAARAEAQAAREVARAALDVAKLHLESTRVTAPADGRIGRPLLDPGNLVRADDTLLATLVSTVPVYAYFDLDERSFLQLRRRQIEAKAPAGADKATVLLGLADEQGFPHQGRMDFIDSRLDAGTGTLRCRAVFPNPAGLLTPGMFARVRLPMAPPAPALLVPERAVGTDQGLHYLLVVTDDNTATYRRVQLGQVQGDLRVVREGLKPGEWVVLDAPPGLRSGTRVEPQRVAAP
jgi:RND family efflux transporter MFP subunit